MYRLEKGPPKKVDSTVVLARVLDKTTNITNDKTSRSSLTYRSTVTLEWINKLVDSSE